MANNNIGWISLHRQIQNHWVWEDANKLKWWIDMLLTVNSNHAKVNIGNEIYDCQRGESLISLQGWASRWNISKDTARNFIKLLEKDNMIKCVSIGKSTRITICNYDSYQQPLHVKQTDVVRKTNAKQTQTNPNNKEDNENNKIEYKKDVFLKLKEYNKLIDENGKEFTDACILHLSNWFAEKPSKKKDIKDHNLTIRRWVIDAVKEKGLKQVKLNGNSLFTQKEFYQEPIRKK